MLLVICDHTFLFLNGIVRTVHMKDIMTNHTTHVLNINRIWLIVVVNHQKMPRYIKHVVKDP
jgi:hypothetical protein